MKPVRRYAQGTEVEVVTTRNQIEVLLAKKGATRFLFATEPEAAIIGFFLSGRMIKITLPLPDPAPQEAKRRWRALLLIIKAKLEAAASGISAIEREFLADTVMPDGATVGDAIEPQIRLAFEEGRMPQLFLAGPKATS